ncbi:MAG: formimidoylglutamase [Bacteroidales bacterium]|nr:formimidoylglutamase [Bacteroidales bacterium]
MDLNSFFEPASSAVVDYRSREFHPMLGDRIAAHVEGGSLPEWEEADLVLMGVGEDRGSADGPGCAVAPDYIRHYLYRLSPPHADMRIVDLGNLARGVEVKDTYYALTEALVALLDKGKTVVLLGGSQDLVFPIYKAYEALGRVINICSVDSDFNLEGGDTVQSNNYLQHIILQQPNYLFDYVALGYQSYFVGPEMVSLMEDLKFSTRRLGEVQASMGNTEPLVRYSDVMAVDVNAVRQGDAPANAYPSPHGLYGEQVCQLARFAGMSDKTSTFALFGMVPGLDRDGQTAHMLAHAIWYFVEGFYYRMDDFPHQSPQHYKRFTVELQDHKMSIAFYKSLKSDRWWMEVPCDDAERRARYGRHTLVPCNYSDYQQALGNAVPDLWWHYYNRINN